ncbi:hypothetical protein RSAG8_07082, partial [Rhizoctonia solani AG-8 WAC10335]
DRRSRPTKSLHLLIGSASQWRSCYVSEHRGGGAFSNRTQTANEREWIVFPRDINTPHPTVQSLSEPYLLAILRTSTLTTSYISCLLSPRASTARVSRPPPVLALIPPASARRSKSLPCLPK